MFKVYFQDYPIVSLVISAHDFADVIEKISAIFSDEAAYHKISEIISIN